MNERLAYSTDETAALLDLPSSTLTRWRATGTGPPAIKLGRHIRYPASALADWLQKCVDTRVPVSSGVFDGEERPFSSMTGGGKVRRQANDLPIHVGSAANDLPLVAATHPAATTCPHPYESRTSSNTCRQCGHHIDPTTWQAC